MLSYGCSDLIRSVDDDTGEDKGRAVLEILVDVGHHTDDYIGYDVSYAEVVLALGLVYALEKIGHAYGDVVASVILCVFSRYLDGYGVDVICIAGLGAELGGADGENARACADVEDSFATLDEILHNEHNESCGLVSTCAERHTGIHSDDDLALLGIVLFPCGNNCDLAEWNRLIILLPALRPVLLVHALDGYFVLDAERGESCLEVYAIL